MRLVAVWGATGFIGKNLVMTLVEHGWQVRALVRAPEQIPEEIKNVVTDIRRLGFNDSEQLFTEALNGVDVVFHCAGDPSSDIIDCRQYVNATRRLILAAKTNSLSRLIHISTVGVYGAQGRKNIDTAHPLEGHTPYALSRIEAEQLVLEANKNGDSKFSATVVRVPMVVGDGMVSSALQRFLENLPRGFFFHPGRKYAVLNCIGVRRLTLMLIRLLDPGYSQGQVLQLADNIRWTEIAGIVAEESGKAVTRVPIPIALAKFVFFLFTGQSRSRELEALANEVMFSQTPFKNADILDSLPDTKEEVQCVLREAIRKQQDSVEPKSNLMALFKITFTNLFARAGAAFMPLVIAWYYGATAVTDALFWVLTAMLLLGGSISNAVEVVSVPWSGARNGQREQQGRLFLTSLVISIPAIFGVLIFVLASDWVLSHSMVFKAAIATMAKSYMNQIALAILFMMLGGFWSGVLLARGAYFESAFGLALKWWGSLFLIVLFSIAGWVGLLGLAFMLGEVCRASWLGLKLGKELHPFRVSAIELVRAIKGFPWREFLLQIATMLTLHINPLVDRSMAGWLGVGGISRFEYAWTIYLIPFMIFTSGYLVIAYSELSTRIVTGDADGFREHVQRLQSSSIKYSVTAVLMVMCLSSLLLMINTGFGSLSAEALSQVLYLSLILTLCLPFSLANVAYTRIMALMHSGAIVLKVFAIKAVLNVIFNLILIQHFGLYGIAFSTVISEIFSSFLLHKLYLDIKIQDGKWN
jgi:nucleoside-diphosphate-sugar epimerase/peptidoglycan biosynthesis protein MviN/MurJ (putative lipid II flippase)